MGGRSSIYHSVVDLVYCVAIPATQVQEKTPKSELEASLKRLATIQKEEGDILIASKDSKYAAGMRINLEILQKDFKVHEGPVRSVALWEPEKVATALAEDPGKEHYNAMVKYIAAIWYAQGAAQVTSVL